MKWRSAPRKRGDGPPLALTPSYVSRFTELLAASGQHATVTSACLGCRDLHAGAHSTSQPSYGVIQEGPQFHDLFLTATTLAYRDHFDVLARRDQVSLSCAKLPCGHEVGCPSVCLRGVELALLPCPGGWWVRCRGSRASTAAWASTFLGGYSPLRSPESVISMVRLSLLPWVQSRERSCWRRPTTMPGAIDAWRAKDWILVNGVGCWASRR